MTEQDQLIALHARDFLNGLSRLPGTRDDGTFDCDYFRDWISQVQEMAAQSHRRSMCDFTLGQFVARGSQRPGENWPSPELARLVEEIGADDFFDGFVNGVLNSRGVVTRDPRAGGDLERGEVERYRQLAQNARPASPKLAEAFLELARHYEADARHEDDEAQRLRLGR